LLGGPPPKNRDPQSASEAKLSWSITTPGEAASIAAPNRNDVLVQKQYMQDIMTSIEEIMNDPSTLSTAVNAIDAVHGKGFAFQPVAKWALYSAFYDASVAHCADKLNAKYIKGPDALGGAETFNFPNCEAYFVARRVGVQ
jgi:hypothetical protein